MTGAVFAGRFAGKVLVVTGAAQGIGRAVALRAAAGRLDVQLDDAEMLMEFVGDGETAAPRLVSTRPGPELLAELFEQLRDAMLTLTRHGWAHGDLSPYNVLLHEERLVLIDWPQIVDVIGNPRGFDFLERDATTMATWFRRKGLEVDTGAFLGDLVAEATSRF